MKMTGININYRRYISSPFHVFFMFITESQLLLLEDFEFWVAMRWSGLSNFVLSHDAIVIYHSIEESILSIANLDYNKVMFSFIVKILVGDDEGWGEQKNNKSNDITTWMFNVKIRDAL